MRMPATELLNPNEIVEDQPSDAMKSGVTSDKAFSQIKLVSPNSIVVKKTQEEVILIMSSQNTSVKNETTEEQQSFKLSPQLEKAIAKIGEAYPEYVELEYFEGLTEADKADLMELAELQVFIVS